MTDGPLIYRLRKRAEIRRQISTRKSVQEGKSDRIADLLEEAAQELEALTAERNKYRASCMDALEALDHNFPVRNIIAALDEVLK